MNSSSRDHDHTPCGAAPAALTGQKNAYPKRLCQVQRFGIEVPAAATEKVRRLYAELRPLPRPVPIARDIWVSGRALSGHTDSTADGKVTYGIVLVADGYSPRLRYRTGNYKQEHAVQAGSVYVIDAREYHSLDYSIGDDGLLAFLAWDLPFDYTLQGFIRRASRSLRRWAKLDQPFMQPGDGI